jgi:hypothetical protein
MQTYPTGVVNMQYGQGPFVPRSLWFFFSPRKVADEMLTKVLELFPDAKLSVADGLNAAGLRVAYQDDADVRIWNIIGEISPGGQRVGEWAGYLADRLINPLPMIDRLRRITYSDGRPPAYSNPKPRLFVHSSGLMSSFIDDSGNFQIGNFVEVAWG